MSDRERDYSTPAASVDSGAEGGAERHDALGPGDGTRTGGSAGAASGHDPMPEEVRRLAEEQADLPGEARTKAERATGDEAGSG